MRAFLFKSVSVTTARYATFPFDLILRARDDVKRDSKVGYRCRKFGNHASSLRFANPRRVNKTILDFWMHRKYENKDARQLNGNLHNDKFVLLETVQKEKGVSVCFVENDAAEYIVY